MKYIIQLFTLIFLSGGAVFAQITKSDIDKTIDFSSLKHPYLYFSEGDKPELLSRLAIHNLIV